MDTELDFVSLQDTPFPVDEISIGRSIRKLREDAGLTVTLLAERVGLSKSAVSKIEKGQISSPVSTFLKIAEGLSVPLGELFKEPEENASFSLTKSGDGEIVQRDGSKFGYSYEALAVELTQKQAAPFLLTIQPGDPAGVFQHGGEEFIHMLSGRLEFTVGEHRMVLKSGDSLYFNPTNRHTTRVMGKKPARFLCVFIMK